MQNNNENQSDYSWTKFIGHQVIILFWNYWISWSLVYNDWLGLGVDGKSSPFFTTFLTMAALYFFQILMTAIDIVFTKEDKPLVKKVFTKNQYILLAIATFVMFIKANFL